MKKMIILLLFVGIAISCTNWRRTNKCFITEAMFEKADKVYAETKSIESVRESLKKAEWEQCEINEAVYRIEKVHHLEGNK